MFAYQQFDPYIEMDDVIHAAPAASASAESAAYWQGMVGAELPEGTRVTVNTDHPGDPSAYFVAITVPAAYAAAENYPVTQVDVFHVIRTNPNGPDSDVSEFGGAQCRDCGAVNVAEPGVTWDTTPFPNGVKPVWRQAEDGAHTLCDDCGTMAYMRTWCTARGVEWDDDGPIPADAARAWDNR